MKKYLLVEGITDVALVKYICFKNKITTKFNDFKKDERQYIYNDLIIVDLSGQDNLLDELNYLKDEESEIEKIGIIQDTDNNFQKSSNEINKAIQESNINITKFVTNKINGDSFFLTPNHKDLGNLETLLLSTLDKDNIPQLQCFKNYKSCLNTHIDITTKAMDKGELYSYTMFSRDGKNYFTPQNSFMYKKGKQYEDTTLWDINNPKFKPITNFIIKTFN